MVDAARRTISLIGDFSYSIAGYGELMRARFISYGHTYKHFILLHGWQIFRGSHRTPTY